MSAPNLESPSPNHHQNPYGVGLAYRYSCHNDYLKYEGEIDLMEVSTEDYIVRERRMHRDPDELLIKDALNRWPTVVHGISLSIGTVAELNPHYISGTRDFIKRHDLNIFSEHLAFHSVDGKDLTMFLCMPFEEIAVQWIKQNYYAVRRELGRPFALENVTYFFPAPHSSLSEADFLRRITEETDCTLLLDITNVFNNAMNHGYDPYEFLDRLPLERVSQMHLAGGFKGEDGKWEDSHSHPVMGEVWPLYEEVLKRSPAEVVVIERDSRFNSFSEVHTDLKKARDLFYRHRPEKRPAEDLMPAFESPTVVENSDPEPLASKFAGLRGYQRSLMGRITDTEFRTQFRADPPIALEQFELTDAKWVDSISDIDPDDIHKLQSAWEYIHEEDKEVAQDYEQNEWAVWAEEIEASGEAS